MAPDRGTVAVQGETTEAHTQFDTLRIHDDPAAPYNAQSHVPLVGLEAIPPHLSHDPETNAKRSDPFQFGQRYLNDADDVFSYNAWDHVAPDEEHKLYSEGQYAKQRAAPVSEFDKKRFNDNPEKWWDLFYKQKSATFFKDRKWLAQEFPVLGEVTKKDAGPKVVLEVGAGAGNTAFPVMRMNENPELNVVAADFSKKAVQTMRDAEDYDLIAEGRDGRKGKMRAEVWDIAGPDLPEGMEEGSADVVVLIFIFSALNPRQWDQAVRNVFRVLKPGGEILFRDYGRGDLAQVRFKSGRWMEENFYVRGDGTRVYFFEKEELERIWSGTSRSSVSAPEVAQDELRNRPFDHNLQDEDKVQNLEVETGATSRVQESSSKAESLGNDGPGGVVPHFHILNLDVDRRLIVNRQQRIKMYRCWMQGQFKKPQ